ncbi:hypothetical protein [Streptomyces hydrogenans]|uniref:hypothetical protein n=1 Tax=Streptomyces hydrogenans TaxID=1873719 RepID=UPI001CFD2D1E|nr:hypothetical protein [Streptomyces hydrogenans]
MISADTLFATPRDATVWLLICAFVLAAAVTRTGLAGRAPPSSSPAPGPCAGWCT